jgi:uncharacterized protein YaiE (UPF0345 family)
MRSIFKRFNAGLPVIALSLLCAATAVAQGQMRDPRVISARAGGVNFVSGEARVKLSGRSHWQTLTAKDTLKKGDTVETGDDSQLEVLLNPGSYFRLGGNSEFTLADDSLDELRLSLTRGSGLIEATGFSEHRISILVETPQTTVEIVRSGIYRINVLPSNRTEVAVYKGRALVGKEQALIKGGRTARVGGAGVEIAKLDKKEQDALDLWSRDRAKMLAKANGKISTRNVNTVLASFNSYGYVSPQFGFSGGFWYFDPRSSCYVYIPGGYGWSSPYGYYYNSAFYWGSGRVCNGCGWRNYDNTNGFGNTVGGNTPINPGSRSTGMRDFPSQPSKAAPDFRPSPGPVKPTEKANHD